MFIWFLFGDSFTILSGLQCNLDEPFPGGPKTMDSVLEKTTILVRIYNQQLGGFIIY